MEGVLEGIGYSLRLRDIVSALMFSALEGYHQYIFGYSVLWVYHQYSGGITFVLWRDSISAFEGYHQYCGGITSINLWIVTGEEYQQYIAG